MTTGVTGSLLGQILGEIVPVEPGAEPDKPDQESDAPDLIDSIGISVDRDQQLHGLARRIAAARPDEPRIERGLVLVCAADHGLVTASDCAADAADPGGDSASFTSLAAIRAIASGQAAVNAVARAADATVLVVDCGIAALSPGGEKPEIAVPGSIDLRLGNGTADVRAGPAMTDEQAALAVESGVALGLSLAEADIDCLALGHIAPGADALIEILCALVSGVPIRLLDPAARELARSLLTVHAPVLEREREPLKLLAALGGYALGVLTGVILAAAARRVLVILDGRGTSLAGLLAARLCPAVPGYLFASHAGHSPGHQQTLYELGLAPLVDLDVARGEGVGAALALPVLTAAVARGTVAPR